MLPLVALACHTTNQAPQPKPVLHGLVSDSTGAIIPGAKIDLLDASGAIAATTNSGADGSFLVTAPHPGGYTLVATLAGFKTVTTPVTIAAPGNTPASATAAQALAAPVHIVLSVAATSTNVVVSADSNQDLTSTDENRDTSVMTANDLKALPIFDNDFVSAMGAFLDSDVSATGGSGLLVDGVEANRVTVSASAVQEVRINQDPYSARYYYPGRGQIEIITKSTADHYHGEFNFYFRDSALNAQNALAPSKPFEQRRIYEGSSTGPIPHSHNSSFLVSFNRAEQDQDAVVSATLAPTAADPTGAFNANVPAPTRDTEFSVRASHQFGDKHSAYMQYSYEDWTAQNEDVGGQSLAAAGYNNHITKTISSRTPTPCFLPSRSIRSLWSASTGQSQPERRRRPADQPARRFRFRLSAKRFLRHRVQLPLLRRRYLDAWPQPGQVGRQRAAPEPPRLRRLDQRTWHVHLRAHAGCRRRHRALYGVPELRRQPAFGILREHRRYALHLSPAGDGRIHSGSGEGEQPFRHHSRPPLRLGELSGHAAAGLFAAHFFRVGVERQLEDHRARRRRHLLRPLRRRAAARSRALRQRAAARHYSFTRSLHVARHGLRTRHQLRHAYRAAAQPGAVGAQRENPLPDSLRPLHRAPARPARHGNGQHLLHARHRYVPFHRYQRAHGAIRATRCAPIPATAASARCSPQGFYDGDGLDISYRGMWNKHFTGFGRYTWSHYGSNTGGIGWFPENQLDPEEEWSNSGYDRRQRFGMYAIFDQKSLLNMAGGIFSNSGSPWTILTGADPYGDGLFNARPDGVGRNSETGPGYVDVDLRWGHDFAITPNKDDEAPHLGFSVSSFNVVNHPNGQGIDTVDSSTDFGQITSVAPPRRMQLAMRFEF